MRDGMQQLDGLLVRVGGGSATPDSPDDIAGLLFWYKTEAIVGLSDGDPLTTWPDSSANGRNATPNGSGCTYQTNELNSRPVVQFDGDYLTFSAASLGTAHSVFLVFRPLAGFSDAVLLGGDALGKYTPYLDGTDIYYRAVGSEAFVSVAHGGLSANTGYLLTIVRSGTSVSFYKNGAQIGTTQTLAANTALTIVQLSGIAGSTLPISNGQIAEAFVYDTALSTTNRQAMEAYVTGRFAIF